MPATDPDPFDDVLPADPEATMVGRLLDPEVVDQVVVQEKEVTVADVLDVLERTGDEVVDTDHAQTLRQQVLAEVRTEEACTAGDDCRGH